MEPSQRPHELAWSIDPPSAKHCELLRGWLSSKLCDWRRRREYAFLNNPCLHEPTNRPLNAQSEDEVIKQEEASYYGHLDTAFKTWSELTDRDRQEKWHYDCATAFAREREKHQVTLKRLDQAEQEIQQLRVRLEQSAQGLVMSDASNYPTTTVPLSREAISHLPDSSTWEYNALVSKWRKRLQSARSNQQTLSTHGWDPSTLRRDHTNGYPPPSVTQHEDSWPSQDGERDAQGDDDDELGDAPGEGILDQAGIPDHTAFQEGTILDPNLHEDVDHRSSNGG